MKKQEILTGNWKNLIILDACRYDYFQDIYDDYLEGNLEKRISRGSSTTEWLYKTFDNYLDAVYFSANPYINEKNYHSEKPYLKILTEITQKKH